MPVTDFDWPLMANYGAGYPYGASGYPDNLPNMRYGPPGGGLLGLPGATPGAPSMGYPAMGQPSAASPGPAQGLSLTSNPITRFLANMNPIGSANASVLHPNLSHPDLSNPLGTPPTSGAPRQAPSPLAPPLAADSLPLAWGNVTGQDYQNWLKMQLASQSPSAATTTSPPAGPLATINPATDTSPFVQPARPVTPTPTTTTSVATAPRGVKRTDAAYGPYGAPGAGAPQGHPSQTPRPASSDRFVRIDRINAGPLAQPGRGYQTALNLAGLFGRS